jgi:hypothetical protein
LKTKIFRSTLNSALAYYNAGVFAVNLKVVGLAPVNLRKKVKQKQDCQFRLVANYSQNKNFSAEIEFRKIGSFLAMSGPLFLTLPTALDTGCHAI